MSASQSAALGGGTKPVGGVCGTDRVVLVVTILLAIAFHHAYRGKLRPYVGLTGDPASIACFAAGLDHAEMFVGDALLGDPDNYRFYGALQVKLLRWLSAHYGGDYGFASDALLGLHFWAYAFGWYLFGCLFWRERWCGVLWMFSNLIVVHLNLSEFWGLWLDIVPRLTFQSVLPWLLSLTVWLSPRSPRLWPLLMALVGSTVWLHPVSAPAWAVAIWLGLWTVPQGSRSKSQRFGWVWLAATVAILALVPFAVLYFTAKQPATVDLAVLAPIVRERIGRSFYDVVYATAGFAWYTFRAGLLPLSLAGCLLWRSLDRETRRAEQMRIRLGSAWLMGLLVIAIGVPAFDQFIAKLRDSLPLQIDLVRNLRYLVPFLCAIWFWPLVLWTRQASNERHRARRIAVVAGVVLLWTGIHAPYKVVAWPAEYPLIQAAVVAVRDHVPVRGRVLTIGINGLPVRYCALRPVVFAEKDGACFLQVRPDRLPEWFRILNRYRQVNDLADDGQRLVAGAALARQLGAEYLLMRNYPLETPPEARLRILFSNSTHRLYAVTLRRDQNTAGSAAGPAESPDTLR